MAYSDEKIDKGALNIHNTPGEKKYLKKSRNRKIRQKAKDIEKENPRTNEYYGNSV